jgi:Ca2+-binding EF-hand superfamily protein
MAEHLGKAADLAAAGAAMTERREAAVVEGLTSCRDLFMLDDDEGLINLADVSSLVIDDVVFMTEVAKKLKDLMTFVKNHHDTAGFDPIKRRLTSDADAALRRAFQVLDKDDSGILSWKELENGVMKASAESDAEIDVVSFSNTIRVMSAEGGDLTEDTFVSTLQQKMRGETGPASSLWLPVYRYTGLIDTYLGLSMHNDSLVNNAHNQRYTAFLQSQNIDTELVEDGILDAEDFEDAFQVLDQIPMLGNVGRSLMSFAGADGVEIPTLGSNF